MASLSEIGMALQERLDDAPDQIAIRKSLEARDEDQIRAVGIEAGKRIDLEEIGVAVIAETDIDATAVAATQSAPGAQRYFGRFCSGAIFGKAIDHLLFEMFLVLVTVAMRRGFVGP